MVLAEDNTLGPFSPYQGRIYAAFVGYFDVANPRTSRTRPRTPTSSWCTPTTADRPGAPATGQRRPGDHRRLSQAQRHLNTGNNQITGRTQFQPEIAVDQSTGTLVISWRDARDDAANARVATYITTSIDGGQTFGPQTYANPRKQRSTRSPAQTNVIGPASDDQSAGNAQTDARFGYGNQMGLAVADGQVYPDLGGQLLRPQSQ